MEVRNVPEPINARLDATCSRDTCSQRGTYELRGRCTNCRWEGTVVLTKGHEAGRSECSRCGCRTVMPTGGHW